MSSKNYRKLFKFEVIIFMLFITSSSYVFADDKSYSDLAKMMSILGDNLHAVIKLLIATSYVMGVWLMSSSINELRVYGQARTMVALQTTFTGPVARLLAGACLMFFPGIIDITIYSLWGYGAGEASILRFETSKGVTFDQIYDGVRLLIQTFGYVSVMRGFLIISRVGKQQSQPGLFGKGMMHIIGGTLAVNVVGTVKILQLSLGFIS